MRSGRFDDAARPQGAWHVVEELGLDLLAAEACPLVFADDLIEEGGRKIGAVFIGRAAGHHGR